MTKSDSLTARRRELIECFQRDDSPFGTKRGVRGGIHDDVIIIIT